MPHLLLFDLGLFFGRFHPLLVHLPIGILLLAVLLQLLAMNKRLRRLGEAVPAALLFGFLSTLPALASGLLLADTGLYHPRYVTWHQYAGISLALVCGLTWMMSIGWLDLKRGIFLTAMGLILILLVGAGHYGAVLTHGEDYLTQFAPEGLRGAMGLQATNGPRQLSSPDSAIVFEELIHPVLLKKCGACHDAEHAYGGLDLTTVEGIARGGASGAAIQPGLPEESELFIRLRLPRNDLRAMPPRGGSLTYGEQRLLAWWIAQGADYSAPLASLEKPEDVLRILQKDHGWNSYRPPYPEMAQTTPLDSQAWQRLVDHGFRVEAVAQSNEFLSVSPLPGAESRVRENLSLLGEAREQLTWLDLSGVGLEDADLAFLGDLPHLSRLRLGGNPIQDEGLRFLAGLPELESLNLVDTRISDAAVPTIVAWSALKRLYVWNTGLSPAGIEQLRRARPGLEIITAFRFAENENRNQ